MKILVFNAGSSSLKFSVFLVDGGTNEVFKGSFERFRDGRCDFRFRTGSADEQGTAECGDVRMAMERVPDVLRRFRMETVDAVGHRVAHGGSQFAAPAILDDRTVDTIEELTPLAPLHNPASLEAIRLCRRIWPTVPQVAVFDTSFHLTNPAFASTYAVPARWRDAGLRRYGFHGTSH